MFTSMRNNLNLGGPIAVKLAVVFIVFAIGWFVPLVKVHAIAPPDVIYNIMQQLPQIIAMVFAFFSMMSVGLYNYIRLFSVKLHLKKKHWVLILIGLIMLSILIGWIIATVLQNQYLNSGRTE